MRNNPASSRSVRFRGQPGNTNSGMALMANVEAYEKSGNLLENASGFEFPAVESADAGNTSRQRPHEPVCLWIIAADDDVALDRRVAVQHLGASVLKCRHHGNSLWR